MPGPDLSERPALVERLHRMIDELRARGVPISLVERIDAMAAVRGLTLDFAQGLHIALSATLIKNAEQQTMFDEVYDLYFRLLDPVTPDAALPRPPEDSAEEMPLDLEDVLRSVLREGSEPLARLLAEQAVRRFARFDSGRPAAGIFYEKWTVEGLRLDQLTRELTAETGGGDAGVGSGTGVGPGGGGDNSGPRPPLTPGELVTPSVSDNAEALRRSIRQVIRELLVADRGVDAVARTLRKPLLTDVDLSMADRRQFLEIERLLVPLQRKLATTVMRRRRRSAGHLDVRATLRASMATGGVPVRVVHRRPAPTKPQLYVLADMSGSVATFASFTLSLVAGLTELFSRQRTFAFIQNAIEVTDLMRSGSDARQSISSVGGRGAGDLLGSYTDYGRSLVQFWDAVGPDLGHRSTVLIFGDGRGNYRPSQEATLARIGRRAGALHWLNPEAKGSWGTGDSAMNLYRRHCTQAITCRTLNDLRRFIEDLA